MKSKPLFLLLITTLLSASASEMHFWRAGHLVVGDQVHFRMDGTNRIYGADIIDIDSHNGRTRVIPAAVQFSSGLAFSKTGDLFVTDLNSGQILVMWNTNNFFEPISITPMQRPLGLALATNGDLYTTVSKPFPAVLRIQQDTGEATVVSSGAPLYVPVRVAIARNGVLFVCNRETPDEVSGVEINDILRIDPNTGAQTVVTAGGLMRDAGILAMDENDDIWVADQMTGLIKVEPTTGKQTLMSSVPATGVTPDGRGGAYFTRTDVDLDGVHHFGVYHFSNGAIRTVSRSLPIWLPTDITVAPSVQSLLSVLVPCEGPAGGGTWRSRGEYISATIRTILRLTRQGIITPADGRSALVAALTSDCSRRWQGR